MGGDPASSPFSQFSFGPLRFFLDPSLAGTVGAGESSLAPVEQPIRDLQKNYFLEAIETHTGHKTSCIQIRQYTLPILAT